MLEWHALDESDSDPDPDSVPHHNVNREVHFGTMDIDTDDELSNVPTKLNSIISGDTVPAGVEIYRCIICRTLPFLDLFQCRQGHIICAGCYQMRVLDKMLGNHLGTCSQCGVRIYRHQPFRNIVGEQRLANIIVSCVKCEMHLPRGEIRLHGISECSKRLVKCKYNRIGCRWKGTMGVQVEAHWENCEYRHKTGSELFSELRKIQERHDEKQLLLLNIMKLLQLPHITARWLHLLPRSDSFPVNVFVVGPYFEAFGQQWSVKFIWRTPNGSDEPNDTETDDCSLVYKLCLETPVRCHRRLPLGLTFTMISSVYSEVRFQPNLCEKFDFSLDNVNGPSTTLYENTWENIQVLLNNRGFYARFLMARI